MASESVTVPPSMYGATPVFGNFTSDAAEHLWFAQALAVVIASRDAMESWNDDIQDALRFLLSREVCRAGKAHEYESGKRASAPEKNEARGDV